MTREFVIKGEVKRRDRWRCQDCGVRSESRTLSREEGAKLHVHHITPKSEGGKDTMENLITLCEECHQKRHSNPDTEFPEEVDRPEGKSKEEIFPYECIEESCDKRFRKKKGVKTHHAKAHGKQENGLYPWQEDWVYIWFNCDWCGDLSEKRQKYAGDRKFCSQECFEAYRDAN